MKGIHPGHLREYVIRPTLRQFAERAQLPALYSEAAVELVFGTIAHESLCGHYLRQHPTGPARGVSQIEGATQRSKWTHYLKHRSGLAAAVRQFASIGSVEPDGTVREDELIANLPYCVAFTRLIYWPVARPLPAATDIYSLAEYWKSYFNTSAGHGTIGEFITNYRRYA